MVVAAAAAAAAAAGRKKKRELESEKGRKDERCIRGIH